MPCFYSSLSLSFSHIVTQTHHVVAPLEQTHKLSHLFHRFPAGQRRSKRSSHHNRHVLPLHLQVRQIEPLHRRHLFWRQNFFAVQIVRRHDFAALEITAGSYSDLVIQRRQRHTSQGLIDGEQRDRANAHAAHQHIFHMAVADQIRDHNSQKRPENRDRDRLRALFGRDIAHVVGIHEPIANSSARRAPREPRNVLSHVRQRRQEQKGVREQRSHHFQPGRDLQQPRREDAPTAGIRVETAIDQTKGKIRGNLYAVKAIPPNCPRPSFKTQLRAAAIGTAPAPIPIAKLRGKLRETKEIQHGLRAQHSARCTETHSERRPGAVVEILSFDRGWIVLE